jgi:glucosamine 6-phosphate synthetase-like amidotransferase/phosphosugar isomerase protein
MCQLITKYYNQTLDLQKAIEKAYITLPSQVVGLYMHETESNALIYARTNMPIFVAYADHGAYIASSPSAFPEDAGDPQLLPAYSYGRITKDGFTANMFSEKAATVAPIDAVARRKVYNTVKVIPVLFAYHIHQHFGEIKLCCADCFF